MKKRLHVIPSCTELVLMTNMDLNQKTHSVEKYNLLIEQSECAVICGYVIYKK